ncbi:hypothetical protein [Nitratireductor indicus]|uniref:hypothetical protein n=1 Tax=Nitratireductor indicus TaxID=721133 RepID=UPI002876482C|nr:hypothetical protein [Nitratireductor indicus]MDS1135168.1 hypothetical protein [Nitratireductor indicus]
MLELFTTENLATAAYGLIIILLGVVQYVTRRKKPHTHDTMLASLGIGWLDRDFAERGVRALERIAEASEVLADRRQADMQHTLHEIVEVLKKK